MNKINICYASSNEYAPYTGISLFSCLENNSRFVDKVFILSFGIKDDNREKLRYVVERHNCEFVIIDAIPILKPIFEKINLDTFRGSYATFSRAFISYLIPEGIESLLYIDSDTIVDGSIEELCGLKMTNPDKVYAAVIGTNHYTRNNPELILDNGNKTYYQAGVIFFNLINWRKYNCSVQIEDYIKNHASSYRNADQTVINNVIDENLVEPLHPKYNYWGHIYRGARLWYQMRLGGFWSDKVIKEAIDSPVIIHYKGHVVHPWKKDSISSLYDRYHFYKKSTPWRDDIEYSIYYDYDKNCETNELRKRYKNEIRYLRYHPFLLYIIEYIIPSLAQIKHNLFSNGRNKH